MVHLWVRNGGDSLQIWRIATDILNKKPWRGNKPWGWIGDCKALTVKI
jgi:hypothetical protein